jgi:hypothetical protein
MRSTLPCLLLLVLAVSVHGQTQRLYLDSNLNRVTDSTKAATKVVLRKYVDDTTLWAASQYTMDNRLIVEGVYKDRGLTVPNGPFKYYYNDANSHYLHHSGYFFNGVKYGEWIDYYPDGKKMKLATLRGDQLNGPYELYNGKDTIPAVKGQYLKGKKNGEWTSATGTDIYQDGVKVRSIPNEAYATSQAMLEHKRDSLQQSEHFVHAVQPEQFASYMSKKLSSYFSSHDRIDGTTSIVILFTVNEKGQPTNGRAWGQVDSELQKRIAKAIDMASPWVPAQKNGKPVPEMIHYTFIENNTLKLH